jgi:predicted alpha/beta superfamily hydrolase
MVRLRILALLFLFSALLSSEISADSTNTNKTFELPYTHRVTISSPSGAPYELVISLPASYQDSPGQKYPVMYYTDAYWDAPLLSSIYLDLAYDRAIPELIMVGLSYSGDNLDYSVLRKRDLTPSKDTADSRDTGGGTAFLRFIKETVIPKIESEYRVDESQRSIAGWSFGGLFALYAMYKEPGLFGRCVAISPSVFWNNGFINQVENDFFESGSELDSRVFISYGENEKHGFVLAVSDFQKRLEDRNYRKLHLMNFVVPNMGHAGSKAIGYAQGLVWIWKE